MDSSTFFFHCLHKVSGPNSVTYLEVHGCYLVRFPILQLLLIIFNIMGLTCIAQAARVQRPPLGSKGHRWWEKKFTRKTLAK
jgi:hypothetical protein